MTFNKDWEEGKATITRKQLADIITNEISLVCQAAKTVQGDETAEAICNLLTEFSANIATEIFKNLDKEG